MPKAKKLTRADLFSFQAWNTDAGAKGIDK